MIINPNVDKERKALEERVTREGLELYKKQKEYERSRKMQEQKEMKDMLEKYWPWGRAAEAKPRGLRNLRLEELFPNKDYLNAQRFVGTVDLGRGGGGAPVIAGGTKVTKTKVDPLLRFQFGSKDLRRCVDNTLRYRTGREQQMQYKKELDQLVEEKKQKESKEKLISKRADEEGWSNEDTLKSVQESKQDEEMRKKVSPHKQCKISYETYPRKQNNFISTGMKNNRRLSSLSGHKDDEGVDLVTLLAKDRQLPHKVPLCSSDVTSMEKIGKTGVWNKTKESETYLRELAQQIIQKQNTYKEIKKNETETAIRHFSTWESFWGRPGHGAPLPEYKKQRLDRLL
ncbi:unnamed protein product, partial [Callosobruchus maculatus]